ncbi:hypothetical protein F5Y16DRAFT_336163 [Xylariaceae sp. FL0255]|nr:hypothetical protein F5Y16DRAFT_336163 [Xylariaceae sp. FL0255]
MAHVRDPIADLDRHLILLEEQVEKLIIALDEWRQWKKEYETLRNDVQELPTTATPQALNEARQSFQGSLVNEKELVDIFGRNDSKKPHQIISTITNRLEYVSKNVDTLAEQLEAAENKLAAARVVSNPDATDEDGLPITEIMEELDDDDNVISYNLRQPGDSQQQLFQALQKAGMEDLIPESTIVSDNATSLPPPSPRPHTSSTPQRNDSPKNEMPPKKKSVTFAESTKPSIEAGLSDPDPVKRLEALYRQAKDQEAIISDPILPVDESPEDAALRQDMIRFNKQTMEYEMGPIVAELQLEEGSTDDDDWDTDESEGDEEDEWGRSTTSVLDEDYKREMLELKQRLEQRALGQRRVDNEDEDDQFAEGIGRINIKHDDNSVTSQVAEKDSTSDEPPQNGTKKSVRFAPSLDIAEPAAPVAQTGTSELDTPEVDPISDIVERRPTTTTKSTAPSTKKKTSRFRRERTEGGSTQTLTMAPEKPTNNTKYAPSGPEGRTLATEVLEHKPSDEIKEPDELDANLLHQQVTEEYYKMRNKMISREGGFLKENEDPIQPLEEEEGGPKRVSRFKAARLARS